MTLDDILDLRNVLEVSSSKSSGLSEVDLDLAVFWSHRNSAGGRMRLLLRCFCCHPQVWSFCNSCQVRLFPKLRWKCFWPLRWSCSALRSILEPNYHARSGHHREGSSSCHSARSEQCKINRGMTRSEECLPGCHVHSAQTRLSLLLPVVRKSGSPMCLKNNKTLSYLLS